MRWAWLPVLAACQCGTEPGDSDDSQAPSAAAWTTVAGPVLEGRVGGGAGLGVSAGDLDGDGVSELLVAEHNDVESCSEGETCASAWLLTVPAEGGALVEVSSAWFSASSEALAAGGYDLQRDMAFPGDLSGDGSADILLLADRWEDEAAGTDPDSQVFLLWSGPFTGEVARQDAVAMVDPMPGVSDHAPCDFDGDGQADLCTNGGLLRGPLTGEHYAHQLECDFANDFFWYEGGVSRFIESGAILSAEAPGLAITHSSQGWEDGAGYALRAIGDSADPCARQASQSYPYDGDTDAAWLGREVVVDGDIASHGNDDFLLVGGLEGLRHMAVLTYLPVERMDEASITISSTLPDHPDDTALVADFDGDGQDDLAWASPGGWVSVLRGPLGEGEHSETADAALMLIGPHEPACDAEGCSVPDGFGTAMAAGDFDGDGREDLAIGAPGDDDTAGRVYIAWGGGL